MAAKGEKAKVAAKTGKSKPSKSPVAKVSARVPEVKPLTAAQKLDAVGIDAICERITKGESITAIAGSFGLDQGSLRYWIGSDASRSACAREARAITAGACDDEALQRIDEASDAFELSKAKEAAHHLRWRASKIAPKDYGDKTTQEITGANGGPLDISLKVTFVSPG